MRSALALYRARESLAKSAAKGFVEKISRLEAECSSLQAAQRAKQGLETSVGKALEVLETCSELAYIALTGKQPGTQFRKSSGDLGSLVEDLHSTIQKLSEARSQDRKRRRKRKSVSVSTSTGANLSVDAAGETIHVGNETRNQNVQTKLSGSSILNTSNKLKDRSYMLACMTSALRHCGIQMDKREIDKLSMKGILERYGRDDSFDTEAIPDLLETQQLCDGMQEIVSIALSQPEVAEKMQYESGVASIGEPSRNEHMQLRIEADALKMRQRNLMDEIERLQKENEELHENVIYLEDKLNIYELQEPLQEKYGNATTLDGSNASSIDGNSNSNEKFDGMVSMEEEMRRMREACQRQIDSIKRHTFEAKKPGNQPTMLEKERALLMNSFAERS